jgi:hypothetical protein
MKKLFFAFLFALTLSFIATGAQAATGRSSDLTFGAGVSSITPIAGGGASLSGLLGFTPMDSVQILVAMPGVNGTFRFGVAGLYKRVILGDSASGFHAGGGVGLGTTGSFGMGLYGLGGIHHGLSQRITLSFDGGATFGIASTTATAPATGTTTQADFSLGAFSSMLGASIHYLF